MSLAGNRSSSRNTRVTIDIDAADYFNVHDVLDDEDADALVEYLCNARRNIKTNPEEAYLWVDRAIVLMGRRKY